MPEALSMDVGRELLDFAQGALGGVVSPKVAHEQLTGAVAVHNLLQRQNVAYLADEVGMGKTYVALGAAALLRHFNPAARILVIAPKQNIQQKWIKEWRNFVKRVVRVEDLRVKGIGGEPARSIVRVDSLADLVTEMSNDPDRDYVMRLPSFSVSASSGKLNSRRGQLFQALPWLNRDLLNAQQRERFKRNFARAANCALPDIDLLIMDEAHNLKAGWARTGGSTRNLVLGLTLGGWRIPDEDEQEFKGFRRKVKRVLFLSATPIEYEVRQLWNQLQVFGFGDAWSALKDAKLSAEEHREVIRKLLVRRTGELRAGDRDLTKTEYRREWRRGGIEAHDEPLALAGDKQRLAVALIQKKVTEQIGAGTNSHSFQVGLLASFESFLETVRSSARVNATETVETADDDAEDDNGLFHRTAEEIAQQRDGARRDGVDVDSINAIARDHRREFGSELPHPKMDAIVNQLAAAFTTGEKALVFVRRVASVDELQRKLEERYDAQLFQRLRDGLKPEGLVREINEQIKNYDEARRAERHRIRARDGGAEASHVETSSVDSFFAWFFRGEGPRGVRSGANIAEQMDKATGAYSTLLEDNYIAALLGCSPKEAMARLAVHLGVAPDTLAANLRAVAARFVAGAGKRVPRRVQMRASQAAALYLVEDAKQELAEQARTTRVLTLPEFTLRAQGGAAFDAAEWITHATLFTELRARPALREALWPEPTNGKYEDVLRERELRRELMSTMIRKGHPIIDLFVLIANRLGTLRARARESSVEDLPAQFAELLSRQQADGAGSFSTFRELANAAKNFQLLLQLNAPTLHEGALSDAPRELGRTLRAQRPVAGMAGKVNTEVVRQFRMPGYPLVLITTDLLKEGEDLHTFCSDVYHYGIAWMPSELEQRVGRIDRVGSLTERRLLALDAAPSGSDKLQVFYPHLEDTVEVLQLRRVYERLNRFIRTMHEGLSLPARERPDIRVNEEGLRAHVDLAAITEPLRSAFNVRDEMLRGARRPLAATVRDAQALHRRLASIEKLLRSEGVDYVERHNNQITGEMRLGRRFQSFTFLLRSVHGVPILRCVSPIGRIDADGWSDEEAAAVVPQPFARIALERNDRYEAYDVAIEGDVLLGDEKLDQLRITRLLESVVKTADTVERTLLGIDSRLGELAADIAKEVEVER